MPMSNDGLTKLIEEMGELTQICAKKIAYPDVDLHPDGKSIKERLQEEMADVSAAMSFVVSKFNLDEDFITARAILKVGLYSEWDKERPT